MIKTAFAFCAALTFTATAAPASEPLKAVVGSYLGSRGTGEMAMPYRGGYGDWFGGRGFWVGD